MAKQKIYDRKRRKYTFTLSDEAHDFLHESVTNASRFVESLILNAKNRIEPVLFTVLPNGMDRAGIEPAASSMPRKRSSPDLSARCYPTMLNSI